MKKLALIFFVLSLSSSLGYAATLQSMSKAEITQALEDKTIVTIPVVTLHGNLVSNTASIYFGKDGLLVGQFANKPDNDPQNDQGTWQAKANGQVCVNWKVWTNGKETCVYTYKLANGLIFINTNHKFESMALSNNIQSGNKI